MIKLSQVSKNYAGVLALHHFELTIDAGQTTVLIGPSGCGKSTLLQLIIGLQTPDSGSIRLAGQVGCGLVGVLYILDEPSIGLHPRDNDRLLNTLQQLRDLGNTVVVVEHDEDTMRAADHLIDFGPGPGVRGGQVVAEGSVSCITKKRESVTGQFLAGKQRIEIPTESR